MARMRWRTQRHTGKVPGQPERAVIPERLRRGAPPAPKPKEHRCAECFGPRADTNDTVFCYRCLTALFGSRSAYWSFIRSERRHRVNERMRRGDATR